MSQLIAVPFHQHSILTLEEKGKRWIAMKPIAEAIGLDWHGQRKRINRDPVLSTCTVIMTSQIPGDDQSREAMFLDLDYLNGWLFGIDANRVKPELREQVIEYQRECYKVLAGHFREQEVSAQAKANKRVSQMERAYFERYPERRVVRELAMRGEPYWYIARIVGRTAGTIGKAVQHLLKWGLMDATALGHARLGMARWWRHRRASVNQLTFGF